MPHPCRVYVGVLTAIMSYFDIPTYGAFRWPGLLECGVCDPAESSSSSALPLLLCCPICLCILDKDKNNWLHPALGDRHRGLVDLGQQRRTRVASTPGAGTLGRKKHETENPHDKLLT